MKQFVITTTSESGDHYTYFIEHPKEPTVKEMNTWLKTNGSDIDDDQCYEEIDDIVEITGFQRL
jgi:hypothetical protein